MMRFVENMAFRYNRIVTVGMPLALLILAGICALTPSAAASEQPDALADQYLAGQHYIVLETPVATASSALVEVVEVFSYMCIHCYTFDPMLSRWQEEQDESVDFVRLPAVFNPAWQVLAQAYYTAQSLGISEEMHEPLFKAVHVDRLDLRDIETMAGLFERYGAIEEQTFKNVYEAFSVKSRVMQSRGKSRSYGITGVPTMIVNGKYRVDGESAGGNEAMLKVVDFLVTKEQSASAD
jgi:thiol:disulfide interchange protein DsbA